MDSFIAVDVETANYERSSICAIGAVKVCGCVIQSKRYSLVRPEPDWYSRKCTAVHGLTDNDTWNAPSFGTLWKQWQPWLGNLPLVAHNAAFDAGCIREACNIYGLECPKQPFMCTLTAARRTIPRSACPSKSLDSLCDFFGISLEHHHNALDDALACAKLAIVLL